MKLEKRLYYMLSLFVLAGCGTGNFQPVQVSTLNDDSWIIYVYRPSSGLLGAGFSDEIFVNEKPVALIGNADYCYYIGTEKEARIAYRQRGNMLTAGPIISAIEKKVVPETLVTIETSAGGQYYVKLSVFDHALTLEPTDAALIEIKKCSLIEQEKEK